VPALFALRQRKIDADVRKHRGDLSTEVTEFLYGFRDLKIYQKAAEKEQQLMRASDTYISRQERENINKLYSQSVNSFISLIISWSVLGLAAWPISNGHVEGIMLAMLVMISLTVCEDAASMAAFPIHFQDSRRAAIRLSETVEQEGKNVSTKTSQRLQTDRAFSIEMEAVSFAFPDEPRLALRNINLTLPAGSKTAIVGPSGSGKSTLMTLLLQMYPVEKGIIRVDGKPMNQIDQESIWENANVVLQENHFFFGTIRDNLRLAGDNLTDSDMKTALDKVKLAYFSLED